MSSHLVVHRKRLLGRDVGDLFVPFGLQTQSLGADQLRLQLLLERPCLLTGEAPLEAVLNLTEYGGGGLGAGSTAKDRLSVCVGQGESGKREYDRLILAGAKVVCVSGGDCFKWPL